MNLLFNHRGDLSEAVLRKCADQVGLDFKRLHQKMSSLEITNRLSLTLQWANTLGLKGTPTIYLKGHWVSKFPLKFSSLI